MLLNKLLLLVAVALCAALAGAEDLVPDIDNNEVLPENDVVRARVDEVPADTTALPPSTSTATETAPTTEQPSTTSTRGAPSSTTPKDIPPPPTAAPTRPPSTLSRFLSDIIQIPIAVLRSVGSLLSSTFAGHGSSQTSGDKRA